MERLLKQRVRLAALVGFGGILALLVAMQLIFAQVTREDERVERSHRVRFVSTSLLISVFRAVDNGNDPAALPMLLSPAQLVGVLPEKVDPSACRAPRWEPVTKLLDELTTLVQDNAAQAQRVKDLRALIEGYHARSGPASGPERADFLDKLKNGVATIHQSATKVMQARLRRLAHLRWLFVGGGLGIALMASALIWRQWVGTMDAIAREEALRAELQGMLAEKTVLLREVNHRVGNGLAMTATLLHLQARHTRDPAAAAALAQARRRTQALNLINRHLLLAKVVERVPVDAVLPGLLTELAADLGCRLVVSMRGAPPPLSVTATTTLALMAHEMLVAVAPPAPPGDGGGGASGVDVEIRLEAAADGGLGCVVAPAAGLPGDGTVPADAMTVLSTLGREVGARIIPDPAQGVWRLQLPATA